MKQAVLTTFVLAKFQSQLEAKTSRDKNRDLAIGDSVGLCTLSSLFEVLHDYFLAFLFHTYVVVFRKPTVSCLLRGTLVCPRIFSWHSRIRAQPTCLLVVTGQFYGKFSGNVDACAVSVYQALLSAYKRESGFEASALVCTRESRYIDELYTVHESLMGHIC